MEQEQSIFNKILHRDLYCLYTTHIIEIKDKFYIINGMNIM